MKRLFVLLMFVCGACAPMDSGSSPTALPSSPTPVPWPTPWPEHERVPVYVFTHLWYKPAFESCPSVGNPADYWLNWVWPPKLDDPCETISGVPWLREISAGAYPLIGLYDGSNEEVIRWQIRQAQAAGIDGFFAGVYSWAPNLGYVYDAFFGSEAKHRKGLLQIAHEEHFHVGIEGWGPSQPDPVGQREPWKAEVARHLAAIEASPYRDAYITIDGKPAYWLIYPQWMIENEQLDFFDGTVDHPRSVNWILRGAKFAEVVHLNEQLEHSRTQHVSWSVRPSFNDWYHNPGYADDLWRVQQMPDSGMIPIAHTYTGYDERPGVIDGTYRGRFGRRNGSTHIKTFLESAVTYGADIILTESFNEWGEGSMLEAGVNISRWRDMKQENDLYQDEYGNDDPYEYLKIFSAFNGMQEWVPPRPPPCSILDPLIRLRNESEPQLPVQCLSSAANER